MLNIYLQITKKTIDCQILFTEILVLTCFYIYLLQKDRICKQVIPPVLNTINILSLEKPVFIYIEPQSVDFLKRIRLLYNKVKSSV